MAKVIRIYHYRGPVERVSNRPGDRNRDPWKDGFSIGGGELQFPVSYPWMTRKECRVEAARDGVKPVFYRDGKPELPLP